MHLKIRTKLILSFFTPIIPLVAIVIIVSVYILNNLYNEVQSLNTITREGMKVADLRLSLDRGLMPVNDYIITGARKYADDFKGISKEIEERFKEVEDVARTSEEMEILKDVKNSWQNINKISIKIYAIPDPVGNKDAARLMEEMDYKWGYPAIERLKRWREIDLEEYKSVLEKHNMAWMRLWTIIIIVSLSFPILCLLYILYYSRQFLKSIDVLKNGAKTIADGNLNEHIDLHTGDEIEELSVLFNSMADNLKVSYTSLEDRVRERTRELKEASEAILRAKNEYEATFDGISDPLFVHDRDFKIVRANRAYAMAAGMDIKELAGKVYYEVFPKMKSPFKMCLKARELQEEEEEEEEEFSYPVTNRIFKIRFYPIKDVNGGYLYSIHILEDITEAKRAADMLQRAYRRLSILYNIDRSLSQSLGLDDILKDGLSMTLKTLEIEGGAITLIDDDGKTMTIRTHIGLSEEFVNTVRHINIDEGISGRAVTEKKPVILNVSEYPTERLAPFIKKEGFQTLVSTPLISAGRVFGALTLATHKIKAFPPEETELLTSIGIQLGSAVQNASLYQSLKISEERYRRLAETSPDMMFRLGRNGTFIDFKPAKGFEPYMPPDQFLGKRVSDVLPENVAIPAIDYMEKAFQTNEEQVFEYKLPIKGEILDFEARFNVITENEILVIVRDITEKKQAEKEMVQQQKLATMGHLVSGIAHEIKNPLSIISGYIQMLNKDEQDTEKKKIYKTVLQQVDRSVKIIDNLLGFARRREYEIKDISINNLIESTIRLVEYEMKLENIIFVRDFEKDLPLVKGDADQLAQVFLNLINNARDSMNEKQKRIKSGELKAEGWKGKIGITTKKTDNKIEIVFADTGLGILEDKVANMFKPFFTTKAEGKGTGLGLSIAKDIIEKHGGKIELENKVGEGVKFIIRLPISSPS